MSVTAKRISYAELSAWPYDGKRYELVDGEVYVSPSPITIHQRVVRNLAVSLGSFVKHHGLGEVFFAPYDVVLSEFNAFQPDLIFVSKAREQVITEKHISGPPDLVVEVLSESTMAHDRHDKLPRYAKYGVTECWYVDPSPRTLELFQRSGDRYLLTTVLAIGDTLSSPLLPGWSIPVEAIFE
ncbi:MAG: Uma2 family endonuclease [Acidobacteria bacterium]|nr:Uma2 family endonuclease [Acidobacteriota bacterium]